MIRTNSTQAWLLATRPKTLTGAFIPVILASALAYNDGCLWWPVALMCLLFAGGMQIVANFINDLYDYLKGTDREDRLGPERACSQGWITPSAMKSGIWVSIVISCGFGIGALALTWQQLPWQGLELVLLGLSCVVFAYLYTRWFSYYGLGDLLVLAFFGFVPVCGTYYLMAIDITPQAWLLGLASGLVIDTLLVVNNYRDREQDRISGKHTIVVMMGERFGSYLYLILGLVSAIIAMYIIHSVGNPSFACLLIVYFAMHCHAWRLMNQIHQGKALNRILGMTSLNMALFAVLLAIGICA